MAGCGASKGSAQEHFPIKETDLTKRLFLPDKVSREFDGAVEEFNWDYYRIPDCGDLDCGYRQFNPCEAYLQYGWENFHLCY